MASATSKTPLIESPSSPPAELVAPKKRSRLLNVLKNITVEPSIFLFMLAYHIQKVPINGLWIDKICRVTLELPDHICENLENTEYDAMVTHVNNKYITIYTLCSSIPATIYSVFLASWSDRYGRKPLLMSSAAGFILFYLACMLVVYFDEASPDYLVLAVIPAGLFGGAMAQIVGCLSFISDVTTKENRTIKFAIVEIAMAAGLALGSYFGGVLQTQLGYYGSFGTCALLALGSFLYSWLALDDPIESSGVPISTKVKDFFDIKNLKSCFATAFKKREDSGRLYIIISIICSALTVFYVSGEAATFYLFTRRMFQWSPAQYSSYSAFTTVASGIGMMVTLPILIKKLKANDYLLGVLGAITSFGVCVSITLATEDWMLYLASTISVLSGGISIPTRVLLSKSVGHDESGKVFAVVAAIDGFVPLVTSVIYPAVFNEYLEIFPASPFILSAIVCSTIFLNFTFMFTFARFKKRQKQRHQELKNNEDLEESLKLLDSDEHLEISQNYYNSNILSNCRQNERKTKYSTIDISNK